MKEKVKDSTIKNIDDDIVKFSKTQFLSAKKYIENVDLLELILDDNKKYSFSEVDELLNDFLEREVK